MDGLPWHLQQERRRCVIADGARKRASWRWTRHGQPVPQSLLRRETEEFDLLHGLVPPPAPPAAVAPPAPPAPPSPPAAAAPPEYEGTSSGTCTLSSSPRSPPEVAVDEEGFEIYTPAAFESTVTRADFVPDEVLDMVTGAVQAHSAEEVQADAKRRRREQDIDQLLLDQGLEQDRLHREKEASSSKGKGKAVVVYVDDDTSDEE